MKQRTLTLVAAFLAFGLSARAGVFHVATYPLRHPIKTPVAVARVATFPLRHPVKTAKALSYPVRHPVSTLK